MMKKLVYVVLCLVSVFAISFPVTVKAESILYSDTRTEIAKRAIDLAVSDMQGEYSWEEFRSCSTFVSGYLEHLSFPVDNPSGDYAFYKNAFPWSSTVKQVEWVRTNYPKYIYDAPVKDFLENKLWNKIKPGDVIYFQVPIGHNGYNTYYHTVVLVGYGNDGPVFAEIAAGMKRASNNRTFEQVTSFYKSYGTKPYDVGVKTPEYLKVTWFDPLAILNEGKLWKKTGVVLPNSHILDNYNYVVTINLFDGTTVVFKRNYDPSVLEIKSLSYANRYWELASVGGFTQFYAVTGRQLPVNSSIGRYFNHFFEDEIYDSDYGVRISRSGVYQHTWTPQMLAALKGFQYINGFGGLAGGTDTSIIRPLIYEDGHLKEDTRNSGFTFHRIPDVENQDMWLRKDLLIEANTFGSDGKRAPIEFPHGNLSSGCVNFEADSWKSLSSFLKEKMQNKETIAVVFSYPNFSQSLLPTLDLYKAPFTADVFKKWCYDSGCDSVDRRYEVRGYLSYNN